jgi:hypothetical protein
VAICGIPGRATRPAAPIFSEMNHRQGTKIAKERGFGLVEKMTGNELPLFLPAMVKKRMNKIETRRHGERRGKRGEVLTLVFI